MHYNTRFNGNYIGNFLLCREFIVKRKENKLKLFNVSFKFSYAGGQYYTPVDLNASIQSGSEVISDAAFSEKAEDIFQMNFSASYRIERKKTSQVIKIDILNATNNQANLYPYYNSEKQIIEYGTQLAMIPNISYYIEF